MSIDSGLRKELAKFCSSKRTYRSDFSPTMPTHWSPQHVRHPDTGEAFTDPGAWRFVKDLLEAGHPVEVITLDKPPGKKGYVLKCKGYSSEIIYIKLQILSGFVIGRSFHVSVVREKQQ
ncbi:hypothetical protein [Celeribacter marinus]|uniref:hypothetical protein n=1 Tax=Celeribacter marinus TaxID=1397108 RepID=UPI00078192F0|nr:hypothetical protein [Celeribacter marinus]SFK80593.1 hypothetical protein SAMN05444421_108187 [Celeribacter marinus]